MARTKQTVRGSSMTTSSTRGRKRKQVSEDSSSEYYSPLSSPEHSKGGQTLAKFPKKSQSPARASGAGTSCRASQSLPARSNPLVPTWRSPRKGGPFALPSFSTEEDDDEEQEITLNIQGDHTDGGAGVQADPADGAKLLWQTIGKKESEEGQGVEQFVKSTKTWSVFSTNFAQVEQTGPSEGAWWNKKRMDEKGWEGSWCSQPLASPYVPWYSRPVWNLFLPAFQSIPDTYVGFPVVCARSVLWCGQRLQVAGHCPISSPSCCRSLFGRSASWHQSLCNSPKMFDHLPEGHVSCSSFERKIGNRTWGSRIWPI